jgi:hypothetical protein
MEWDWWHTIVMVCPYDGWKKNYSHTHWTKTAEVYVKGFSAEGHFVKP